MVGFHFQKQPMTPKQIDRLKKKIARIKGELAAEKRKFGGYHDGGGLRYIPTEYYVRLSDFSGGLRYTRWFAKNFPDDCGDPNFLFEWTIILFQKGKIREAEKKAFQTFCSNTYLFDKFFGRPIRPFTKWEGSNLQNPSFVAFFPYSTQQIELSDFSRWLESYLSSEKFVIFSSQFIEINERLKTEQDLETRLYLLRQSNLLEESA
jgi:hypothetical protein